MAKPKTCKLVPYYRTSTDDQTNGIDAQEAKIQAIARERGCSIERAFTEHESGGDNGRPELDKAIRHARRIGATLAVAKLDRLARDSTFLMQLYDGDVPILFGDLPEIDGSAASRMMVQMLAMVAEFERKRIGERTREALAVLKAKGVKLGTPENLTPEAQRKGSQVAATNRVALAIAEQSDIAAVALPMRKAGATFWAIAHHLNAEGYTTRKGGSWSATQVQRVLDRLL